MHLECTVGHLILRVEESHRVGTIHSGNSLTINHLENKKLNPPEIPSIMIFLMRSRKIPD